MRTLRNPFHSAVLTGLVLVGLLSAAHPVRAEEWTKTFDLTGRPAVHVATDDAAVQVVTGESKQVSIRIEYQGYRLDRDLRINARQNGDRVELDVRTSGHWCLFCSDEGRSRNVRIEVRVPREADLSVESGDGSITIAAVDGNMDIRTGDGHIELNGARGTMRLRTGDGGVDATRLDGQLEASSGDGRIHVDGRFDRLNLHTGDGSIEARALPGSKMLSSWSIHTGDGSVDLSLPDGFQANIDASTSDGTISLGLPLLVEGGLNRTNIHGKLNGGGQSLTISTGDGSVRISRL
jgi:Putative adhesin